jgi:iron complex transport system substrate-binding protein
LLAIVTGGVLPCACRDQTAPAESGGSGISVVDDLQQTVTLPRPARRIIALSPSNVEILFAIGCGEYVSLRDELTDYPKEALALPATSGFRVSVEQIVGYRPDLVLVSHLDSRKLVGLRSVGISVASFDPQSVDQLYRNIAAVGTLCGRPDRASALVDGLRQRVSAIEQRARMQMARSRRLRVYVELDGSDPLKPWTAGRGSLIDQLVTLAGGLNVAHALGQAYGQISAEAILKGDPDLIILANGSRDHRTMLAELRRRPGWSTLRAARGDNLLGGETAQLLTRPGPRLVLGLERLVQRLRGLAESPR